MWCDTHFETRVMYKRKMTGEVFLSAKKKAALANSLHKCSGGCNKWEMHPCELAATSRVWVCRGRIKPAVSTCKLEIALTRLEPCSESAHNQTCKVHEKNHV